MPFKSLTKFGKKKQKIEDFEETYPEVQEPKIPVSDVVSSIIKQRRSIRKYLDKEVTDDMIFELLDAARYAPSEGNQQPWEFIIVRDIGVKKQLVAAAYGQMWMLDAPVFIVACINMRLARSVYGERGEKLYGIQSVAAAIQNILLAAESMGLGTCWVGAFTEGRVAILLGCPDHVRPCAIITVGWSAEKPAPLTLQMHEDYVHLEWFGQTPLHKKVKREKKPHYMKFM